MIMRGRYEFPEWGLTIHCSSPWCLLHMTVEAKDIRFGPYPEDKPLKGEGFYFHCPSCKKVFPVHESMLFAPHVEKLLAR